MGYEAVYLDRDGVLNEELGDYVTRPADLRLIPGAAAAVRRLNEAGLPVVVVTNQAGIGKGLFTAAELQAVLAEMERELGRAGAYVDAVKHCPHRREDGCACRKPQPAMLLAAAAELGFDPRRAVLVGDLPTDLAAAAAVGAAAVLVRTGYGRETEEQLATAPAPATVVLDDLPAAVDWILGS